MHPDPDPADPSGSTTTRTGIETRRSFLRLTDADLAVLAELKEVFEGQAESLVEAFYAHLTTEPAIRGHLDDPAVVQRLKAFQRTYLISLTAPTLDAAYVENRLGIGRVHERIGLAPQWYLGTYGLYIELLLPLVQQRFTDDPERASRASAALVKRMILDVQIVLDAYHELRQRRVVERSEHLAAVGQLAASIAHEVRNPLAGIQGALQVMRRRLEVPENQQIVDDVLRQVERMELLVRDLLAFARPRPAEPRWCDLTELLERLARHFGEQAAAAGVSIVIELGEGATRVWADPQQLEQTALNLIQNALQAMERGGRLRISSRVQGRQLGLEFADSGRGISKAVLARVFEPFFTTKSKGSGLGLTIVRRILDDHVGEIFLTSEEGRGTRATLLFPHDPREPN